MTDRVIDVADASATLSLSLGRLRITVDGAAVLEAPLRDIGALVVSSLRAHVTVPLLSALSEQGIMLVVCNQRHLPSGWLFVGRSRALPEQPPAPIAFF